MHTLLKFYIFFGFLFYGIAQVSNAETASLLPNLLTSSTSQKNSETLILSVDEINSEILATEQLIKELYGSE